MIPRKIYIEKFEYVTYIIPRNEYPNCPKVFIGLGLIKKKNGYDIEYLAIEANNIVDITPRYYRRYRRGKMPVFIWKVSMLTKLFLNFKLALTLLNSEIKRSRKHVGEFFLDNIFLEHIPPHHKIYSTF